MPDDPTKSTVYIDVEDDISTIIEKAEDASKSIVALVLPKRSGVLQSIVNMRLLKQSTEAAGKKVVLITSEAALLPLAGAVGLPVSRNLQTVPEIPSPPEVTKPEETMTGKEKPTSAAKKPLAEKDKQAERDINKAASVGALADAHERKEPETVELGDEDADEGSDKSAKDKLSAAASGMAAKLPKVPNFERFRKRFILGGAGLIGFIVFLYLAMAVLPKATISITTTATPISLNMNLTTSGSAKKLDTANNIIPSSLQTYKQTADKKITPTGRQDIGSKATGTATLSVPCAQVTSPINIPAGTGISAGSLTFITQSSVALGSSAPTFPGGVCTFSGSTNIIAQSAGSEYNNQSSFTVNGHPEVDGSASPATSGGSSQVVTVVSQQDLDNALKDISNDGNQPSQDKVTEQFKAQLDKQDYYLIASTLKVSKPSAASSPAVGQQASSATVTVTTTYSVLVVKKADFTKLITNYAQQQIDKNKQQIETTDILKDVTTEVTSQSSPTDAALSISGNVNAMPLIDIGAVKQEMLGKKKGAIISELSDRPGVKNVDVRFSPFWVSKVPASASKVTVNIHSENGSN